MDLWDPHPESPYSTGIKAIDTTVSGLKVSHLLPRMAEQMHRVSLIRSMVSKEGDHERGTYYVQTGYRPDPTVVHPALGAILAHELPDASVEIPQHVSLASGDGFVVPRGGYLGNQYDAFRIYDPGKNLHNMKQRVGDERQQHRLEGLDVVTQVFRRGRSIQADRTLHQQVVERALTMMSSEQLKAFQLDDEPQAVLDRYGDTRFGRGCLVARRLVEEGVRAVQVVLGGFDSHVNNLETQSARAADLDPAISSLIDDLAQRDLLDSTIVLCLGEFGRTPWLNPLEGRDHWPNGFSCVLAGGGLRSGVVIGETNPAVLSDDGDRKVLSKSAPADPIPVPDLFATVLKLMGLDPEKEILTPIGRPIALTDGVPIERLIA